MVEKSRKPKSVTPSRPSEVVARRVKALREDRGWSARKLAQHCAAISDNLTEAAIEHLEGKTRSRDVSVDELLALAHVLGVAPVELLVDLRADYPHPVLRDVTADHWAVMLWAAGVDRPEVLGGEYLVSAADTMATGPLKTAQDIRALVDQFRLLQQHRDTVAAVLPDQDPDDEQIAKEDRAVLQRLARALHALRTDGYRPPPVPEDVRNRADELGIALGEDA